MAALAFDKNYPGISVYKALTNKELTDEEKAEIIAEAIESISKEFPNLKNVATKRDLSETELRLLKEIKELDAKLSKEIKELDAKLSKEIKELDAKLSKEIKELDNKIENTKFDLMKQIKELDNKLSKEIKELDNKIENTKFDLMKQIKELDIKSSKEREDIRLSLTKEIEKSKVETIKWVTILMIGQIFTIAGIVAGIFKFFVHS